MDDGDVMPQRDARPSTSAVGSTLAGVGRSAVLLTGAQVVVQAIGIIRQVVLASREGITVELDALIIGLNLPLTLYLVLLAGVRPALVPAYFEARSTMGQAHAGRLAGTVLVWMSIIGLLVSIAMYVFAGPLATISGPGFSPVAHASTVGYIQLLSPMVLLGTATGILLAVSQSEERFALIAWATIAAPAIALVIMLAAWDQLRLDGLAVGTLVGAVASLGILVVGMGWYRILPRLGMRPSGLGGRALVRHATPLTMSAVILQLNTIGDNAIASLLAPGAVSALRYADSLIRLPISAVQSAWGTAVYPALVRATREPGVQGLARTTLVALRYVLAIFVPIAALTAACAPLAVAVAYGWGEFSQQDLTLTAQIVAGFAPLMVVLMVVPVFTGAFNARRNGTILLMGGVLNVTLNLTLDVVLGLSIGVVGVALASSAAQTVVVVIWAYRFRGSDAEFDLRHLADVLGRAIVASAPAALLIGGVLWAGAPHPGIVGGLMMLGAAGLIGLATYVLIAARIGLREPRRIMDGALGQIHDRLRAARA